MEGFGKQNALRRFAEVEKRRLGAVAEGCGRKEKEWKGKTEMLDFAYNCIHIKDCFEQKKTAPYGAVPSHDFFTVPGRWFHGPGDIPKRIKSCHDPQLCLL